VEFIRPATVDIAAILTTHHFPGGILELDQKIRALRPIPIIVPTETIAMLG
jgi:hypothetical protein